MELTDVREYLKQSKIEAHYSIGKINADENKSIGIYQGRRGNEWMKHVGKQGEHPLKKKSIEVLIHWNQNEADTERTAQQIYDYINKTANERTTNDNLMIGKNAVSYIRFFEDEPIDLSTYEKNMTYERYIDFIIYYI